MSARLERVIPYVEDRKNSLLIEFVEDLDESIMVSLQAALKNAIQTTHQLEDSELAAQLLPSEGAPRLLLFYEAAEGGAGVLRHLVDDPGALARVALEALRLCHFNPQTGDDLRKSPGAREECEAACYNCLMSYGNQMVHKMLDRKKIRDCLRELAGAEVMVSPSAFPRATHLERLMNLCQSELERQWLRFLQERDLNLPSHAQRLIERCHTRPDFFYEQHMTTIYIDGPPHDYPERQERDSQQMATLEDQGYSVVRFGHQDNWEDITARYPGLFGSMK